jgi:hypothetical protein
VTHTPELDLFHELGHAWLRADWGNHPYIDAVEVADQDDFVPGTRLPFSEVYAVRIENQIGAELRRAFPDKYGDIRFRQKYPLKLGRFADVPRPFAPILSNECACKEWYTGLKNKPWGRHGKW